jgi:hypothetical protein
MRITLYPAELERLARRYSTPERVEIANEIESGARARAKVVTGKFASSYGVEVSGEDVTVVNTDPAATYIVLGTSDTPPHAEMIDEARKHGRYSGVKPKRG